MPAEVPPQRILVNCASPPPEGRSDDEILAIIGGGSLHFHNFHTEGLCTGSKRQYSTVEEDYWEGFGGTVDGCVESRAAPPRVRKTNIDAVAPPPFVKRAACDGIRSSQLRCKEPFEEELSKENASPGLTLLARESSPQGQAEIACTQSPAFKGPSIHDLHSSLTAEQERDEQTRRHSAALAAKDWQRDYGHCFPDLFEVRHSMHTTL